MNIILIFIDGLGLGENNPEINPFARYYTDFFKSNFACPFTKEIGRKISSAISLVPLDASLGVEGLPQSATGQTALFTGINAPKEAGRHIQAFPGPQLTKIIAEHGIMKQALAAGLTATSANMYSPDYLELVRQRKRRNSVTTLLSLTADIPLRSIAEMKAGEAVYQDITNEMLPAFGVHDINPVSPAVAANRLLYLAKQYNFTVFEYFQTDRIGHKQNWDTARSIINVLDEFLSSLQQGLPKEMAVIVTSDHGNFEDFSVKTHTRNLIPLIVFGHACEQIAQQIYYLTDVTPVILSTLKGLNHSD